MKKGMSTDQLIMLVLTAVFFILLFYFLASRFFGGA